MSSFGNPLQLIDAEPTQIAKTFPFAQTVEAYRYLESNEQIGKVVITVP